MSKLDWRRARYGTAQRHGVRIRVGKADLFFKLSDDVLNWKKPGKLEGEFADWVREVSSRSVVGSFKVEGPFELRVDGDHELSLQLPLNNTHSGLRRVFVSEGITVEVIGAHEVFLFYELDFHSSDNGTVSSEVRSGLSYWQTLCIPLIPVHVIGSASLIAYRTRNPSSHIETSSPSKETIELLPEKCYNKFYRKHPCPIDSLSTRISMLERVLRSLMGDRVRQNMGFVKANIKALTFFRFRIQLERDIRRNDTRSTKFEKWRTRPIVERAWFEVVAKLDGEQLKPVIIKKVKPFIAVDTVAWSSLSSNVSFTKFPPVLLPPESLTLDVKW